MTSIYDVRVEHVDPKLPAYTEVSVYEPVVEQGVLSFVRQDGTAVLVSLAATEVERVLTRPSAVPATEAQLNHPFYYDAAPSRKYVPSQTLEGMAADAELAGTTWDVRTWNVELKRAGDSFTDCRALMVRDGTLGVHLGPGHDWPIVTINLHAGVSRAEVVRHDPPQE